VTGFFIFAPVFVSRD